jgi:hypothetical protein
VCGIARRCFERVAHDGLDLGIVDPPRRAGAGLIEQSLKPAGDEPRTPFAHHLRCHADSRRDGRVRGARRTREHDARPLRERLRRLRPPRPLLEHLALRRPHH